MSPELPHEPRTPARAEPFEQEQAARTQPPRDAAPAKRPMTLAEAGRRGGEKVKRERGAQFYAEIGRKGGRRVAESHGPSFYAEIGRKGGESRRRDPSSETDEPVE